MDPEQIIRARAQEIGVTDADLERALTAWRALWNGEPEGDHKRVILECVPGAWEQLAMRLAVKRARGKSDE